MWMWGPRSSPLTPHRQACTEMHARPWGNGEKSTAPCAQRHTYREGYERRRRAPSLSPSHSRPVPPPQIITTHEVKNKKLHTGTGQATRCRPTADADGGDNARPPIERPYWKGRSPFVTSAGQKPAFLLRTRKNRAKGIGTEPKLRQPEDAPVPGGSRILTIDPREGDREGERPRTAGGAIGRRAGKHVHGTETGLRLRSAVGLGAALETLRHRQTVANTTPRGPGTRRTSRKQHGTTHEPHELLSKSLQTAVSKPLSKGRTPPISDQISGRETHPT